MDMQEAFDQWWKDNSATMPNIVKIDAREAFYAAWKIKRGEPVATAWMQHGKMVNAFPYPPNPDYNLDGYWTAKGYTLEPLYK